MSKFKIGDKVRVMYVDNTDTYSVGDEGKVVGVNPLGVFRVEFDNYLSDCAVEKQLELIPKFKVGDKVVVIGTNNYIGNNGYFYTEGMVGSVEGLREDEEAGVVVYIYFEDTGNWPEGAVKLSGCVWAGEEDLSILSKNQNWWETPEGIEWLSTQQDVEEQLLKSQEGEGKTYRIGQRFLVTHSTGTVEWHCLLAQVGSNMVCFINLESGNRINEPIHVLNLRKITEDEMGMIAEDCSFQLL